MGKAFNLSEPCLPPREPLTGATSWILHNTTVPGTWQAHTVLVLRTQDPRPPLSLKECTPTSPQLFLLCAAPSTSSPEPLRTFPHGSLGATRPAGNLSPWWGNSAASSVPLSAVPRGLELQAPIVLPSHPVSFFTPSQHFLRSLPS